jgi:hypothetical protein
MCSIIELLKFRFLCWVAAASTTFSLLVVLAGAAANAAGQLVVRYRSLCLSSLKNHIIKLLWQQSYARSMHVCEPTTACDSQAAVASPCPCHPHMMHVAHQTFFASQPVLPHPDKLSPNRRLGGPSLMTMERRRRGRRGSSSSSLCR